MTQFGAEGETWHGIEEFDLLERNISVPGFSPLYPDVHCTSDGLICQLVTGSGEINAVATISALLYSDLFDLRKTYFLIAGIAGINPKKATIGSVTVPLYAVHVGLQFLSDLVHLRTDLRDDSLFGSGSGLRHGGRGGHLG